MGANNCSISHTQVEVIKKESKSENKPETVELKGDAQLFRKQTLAPRSRMSSTTTSSGGECHHHAATSGCSQLDEEKENYFENDLDFRSITPMDDVR